MQFFHNMLRYFKRQNLFWLGFGAFTIGIAYFSFRYFKNNHDDQEKDQRNKLKDQKDERNKLKDQNTATDVQQRIKTSQSAYSQFYFDKDKQLHLLLEHIKSRDPTVQEVYELSPLILIDQYLRYTKEIRKRRRLIRKVNEDQYIAIIANYEMEVQELLQRGRSEMLNQFNIEDDDFYQMEASYELIEDLRELKKRSKLILKEKAFPVDKMRRISEQKLKKIINEEINFIGNKLYSRLKQKLQEVELNLSQEDTFKILNTLCDDILYEKYGYQREEIQHQLQNTTIQLTSLNTSRNIFFADIVDFQLDSAESLQEDDQYLQNISKSQAKTMELDVVATQ